MELNFCWCILTKACLDWGFWFSLTTSCPDAHVKWEDCGFQFLKQHQPNKGVSRNWYIYQTILRNVSSTQYKLTIKMTGTYVMQFQPLCQGNHKVPAEISSSNSKHSWLKMFIYTWARDFKHTHTIDINSKWHQLLSITLYLYNIITLRISVTQVSIQILLCSSKVSILFIDSKISFSHPSPWTMHFYRLLHTNLSTKVINISINIKKEFQFFVAQGDIEPFTMAIIYYIRVYTLLTTD